MQNAQRTDVVVVGGGLAGLAAGALLAQRGLRAVVLEKSGQPGGRARTGEEGGFFFNLGPRALYRIGAAAQILRSLGVRFHGRGPRTAGLALRDGQRFLLPTGIGSLMRTRLFGVADKLQFALFLTRFPKIEPRSVDGETVESWLAGQRLRPRVAEAVGAFLRLATYCNDFEIESAGAAVEQLQMALSGGVKYLDGGWQTLVDGLREALTGSGGQIVTQARAEQVIQTGDTVTGIRLAGGKTIHAPIVVLACEPAACVGMLDGTARAEIENWRQTAIPIRAACVDVGLRTLPRPQATFALGIDRPWYLSVHSATARLAPPGAAMIHVLRYLSRQEDPDPESVRQELEGVLDLAQPGWRNVLVRRADLPSMCVTSAIVRADQAGTARRPGPAVTGTAGLYVIGDWVGQRGMLVDASLASAQQAVEQIMRTRGATSSTRGAVDVGLQSV